MIFPGWILLHISDNRTCGVGYHKRVRECLSPAGCGAGDSSDIQQCMQKTCTAELYGM